MKVLIVGGGIGGLTAALCCCHFGHDVRVFERAPQITDIGAGIQISPNAVKVFRALGLEAAIADKAFRPQALEARMGESGRHIFSIPLASHAEDKWGAPYFHIHRADLIDVLKTALDEAKSEAFILSATAEHYSQNDKQVTVHLMDGREFTGDVLIGADGIKSVIRQQMLGDDKPIFTGNIAWRAVVETKVLGEFAPNPTACVWMGRGRHCVSYRLKRGGGLTNFVGVVERDDWTEESWTALGHKDDLLKDFTSWHPVIEAVLKAANETELYQWALFDRKPLPRWQDGRAALLGDAAHPMLPFLAQGAAMAIEDGWSLAAHLSASKRPIEQSLMAYQNARLARTAKVQGASRKNMRTFHKSNAPSQIMTYAPMWLAGHLMPQVVHNRMNWLYGYGVTQDKFV